MENDSDKYHLLNESEKDKDSQTLGEDNSSSTPIKKKSKVKAARRNIVKVNE